MSAVDLHRTSTPGLDHLDLGLTPSPVVDDDGGAFGDMLAIDELFAGLGTSHVGESRQPQPGVELALVSLTQAAQGPLEAVGTRVSDPEEA